MCTEIKLSLLLQILTAGEREIHFNANGLKNYIQQSTYILHILSKMFKTFGSQLSEEEMLSSSIYIYLYVTF